jgi:phospholipid-binding lipoprotein MlaA
VAQARRLMGAATVMIAAGLWCGCGVLPRSSVAASATPADRSDHDPIEPFNRGIFWFNDHLDMYVLEPVAKGYDAITPKRVQQCLGNFFQNLRFPVVAVNDLLQAKPIATATDIGRFLVNTTVGLAGFFDPATGWGLESHDEDFGQTLGYWGTPAGPYLVLPFWGPSSIRDGVGLVGDSFGAVYPWLIPFYYSFGAQGVRVVNTRASVLSEVQQVREASLDYYTAVRSAYIQYRQRLVEDRTDLSEQEQEDLYTIDVNGGE